MKIKTLLCTICVAVLALAALTSTSAEDNGPARLTGVINDYAPTGTTTTAWELHGPWSLTLNRETGKAHFSAALTMGLSMVGQGTTAFQDISLAQHTHNITMDGTVTYNPTDCPPASAATPAFTARIELNNTANVFANGNVPPFGESSPLQVCISGGVNEPDKPIVPLSNITLKFGADSGAATHFGSQAIHGVVSKVQREDRDRGR